MKKDQVKIGGTYLAKVSDKVVPVRIDAVRPTSGGGGWDATNLSTNKQVRIKSAQRLRGPAPERTSREQVRATTVPEQENARPRDPQQAASTVGITASEQPTIAQPATLKPARESKPYKTSGLDAAYQVLVQAGAPMRCGDLVARMLAQGLWKTGGKTPAATIYSAMVREIDTKPGASRFKKIERGLFTVTTPRA